VRRSPRGRLTDRRGRVLPWVAIVAALLAASLIAVAADAATPSRLGSGGTAERRVHAAKAALDFGRSDVARFVHAIRWTSSSPAPGVELRSGEFHDPDVASSWTVTIQAPTASPFGGSVEYKEAGDGAWAGRTEAALISDGFSPRADTLRWPRYLDDPRGEMGVRVRVGQFQTKAAAVSQATALTAAGFNPLVEWEGFDPRQTPDAELLHAVIVDPRAFSGHVVATHGTAVASREPLAAQSQQLGALAGVNAGFFTIASPLVDVAGVPTGLGAYGGRLEALSNDTRADLVLEGRRPARIENLRAGAQLRDEGSVARILGVNRQPGSNEDCGVPGFAPTSAPRQGLICTGTTDLVLFTPEFGAALPAGPGLQLTVDAHGRVLALGARGGSLSLGESAVQAIGTDADWVRSHVRVGDRVSVNEQLRQPSGASFRIDEQTSIVSAAPILLRDGRIAIDAVREGVFDPRDLYDYGFSAERHARTIAGVDRKGRLILVTADGVPGISEGLTLTEEAELMRTLGAVDAMNLDGGGSTTFVVGGTTINHPSDATGARAIGDSIEVVP
jgi:hypothetical protein